MTEQNLKQLADLHDENIELKKEIERLKAEREWIKIDQNVVNIIPDENLWVYWFKLNKVVFVPKGEFIPLGVVSHYMLLSKPEPPKQ
jgi:hypothetical protein